MFYNERHVKKSRKVKICRMCRGTINIGEPAVSIPTYDLYSIHLCLHCYNFCVKNNITSTDKIFNYDITGGELLE